MIPEKHDTAGIAQATLAEAAQNPALKSEIDDAFNERWRAAEDPRLLDRYAAYLPELPDQAAQEAYDLVEAWERFLLVSPLPGMPLPEVPFAKVHYNQGKATTDNALEFVGHGPVLMEAQHASDPVRKQTGMREAADHGTAGLAAAVAVHGMGRAIIPVGRQTGNANVNPEHPIKAAVSEEMASGAYEGFMSIHGKIPGRAIDLRDRTEVHAVIGLGRDPQDSSLELAEMLTTRAKVELGLRLVIGNFTPQLRYKERPNYDGRAFRDRVNRLAWDNAADLPALSTLAAASPNSTTTYAQEHFPSVPAMQLEISRSLRLTPHERDKGARIMGVYLGYSLVRIAAELYGRSYTT